MRILAVRGSNLASLAREFEVDLVDGDLGGVGIFAICGPVGAGKSTLLDALCLALFDRTPRLSGRGGVAVAEAERPEKDWLHSHDPRSLLRRGAGEGYAEVDFSGRDGRRYRARWSVRRARRRADGRVQPQELTLTNLDRDVVVAQGGKSEVLAAIRARLGLDFGQFCRSVLLAQGDFAAFLRAPADVRASLLESLTGADVYRRLSRAAHERSKNARQDVERLEAQIEGFQLLADDEREQLRAELAALEAQKQVNTLAVGLAQSVVSWYATAASARDEENKATADLDRASSASRAAEPRRQQVSAFGRALPLVPRLERVAAAQRDVVQVVADSEQLAEEHRKLAAELEHQRRQLLDRLLTAFGATAAPPIIDDLERWRPSWGRWLRLEVRWQSFDVAREAARPASHEAAAAEAAARARAEAPEFAQLPAQRQRVVADRERFERLQTVVRQWESCAAEVSRLQAEVDRRDREREALCSGFEALASAQREAEQQLAKARDAVEHQRMRSDLAAFRSHLEAGKACPLCGSAEHPDPVATDDEVLAAVARELTVAETARDLARDAVATREAQRHECERGGQAAQVELAVAQTAATAAVAACRSVLSGMAASPWPTVGDLVGLLPGSQPAIAPSSESPPEDPHSSRSAHSASPDGGIPSFDAHSPAALTAVVAAVAELGEDLAQRDRELAAASDRFDLARSELTAAERRARLAESAVEALRELDEAAGELAPAWSGIEDWQVRVRNLGSRASAELEAANAAAVQCANLASTLDQRAEKLAASRTERVRREQELAAANSAFESELAKTQLDARTVREAADLGGERVQAEAEELRELAEAERETRAVLKKCVELRRRHEDSNRPAILEGDATRALEDARVAAASTNDALKEVNARLGADGMLRQRRDEIAPHLAAARKNLEVWAALDGLIGHSRGDRFAVFAQSLTLDLLLLEANHRLAELAPRYRLEKNHGRDMDFVVVDLELGGVRRGLQSLSGGETFLVSLALALALASLAAPRSRVETLFLDEGFGTLDATHLEAALGALDSLQAAGCQIGIISHVEGIAERIGAVVDVRPDGGGQSRITVRTS